MNDPTTWTTPPDFGSFDVGDQKLAKEIERRWNLFEGLAKDANRYRWLNAQDNFMMRIDDKHVRLKCGDVLDIWIDARIAEQRGGDTSV